MIEVQQYSDISKICNVWEYLYGKNRNASVYQSAVYNRLIWSNIRPYRYILRMTPVFYVFYEKGNPILIIPLFKSIVGNNYRVFGDKAGCGYLDFIYDEVFTIDKLAECLKILSERFRITQINLNHVRSNTILGQYALRNGGVICDTPCISILLPEKYAEYYESLSKNMRQNIRTSYNRLVKDERTVDFKLCKYSELSTYEKKKLLEIYIERQLNKYKKFGKSFYKYFVTNIDIGTKAENFDDLEDVFILLIDGDIAAFFDAIYYHEIIVVPRLCIVEEYSRYSPGIILLNEAIKMLLGNSKIKQIDLTHGNEQYKKSMGGKEFYCVEGRMLINCT